jgi:hypothetical protein
LRERGYAEAYSVVRSHVRHIQPAQPVPFDVWLRDTAGT